MVGFAQQRREAIIPTLIIAGPPHNFVYYSNDLSILLEHQDLDNAIKLQLLEVFATYNSGFRFVHFI